MKVRCELPITGPTTRFPLYIGVCRPLTSVLIYSV